MSRCFDKPLLTWWECVVLTENGRRGAIVDLPHSADRLSVGVATGRTCAAFDADPEPRDVTARQAHARLLTLREQWEWQQQERHREPPYDDPPADWFPDESIPSWVEDAHGGEVWIAEWSS